MAHEMCFMSRLRVGIDEFFAYSFPELDNFISPEDLPVSETTSLTLHIMCSKCFMGGDRVVRGRA